MIFIDPCIRFRPTKYVSPKPTAGPNILPNFFNEQKLILGLLDQKVKVEAKKFRKSMLKKNSKKATKNSHQTKYQNTCKFVDWASSKIEKNKSTLLFPT